MASSSYHYGQYQFYKKQALQFGKNISALTGIKDGLLGGFYDEQGNVNKELDDLREDLDKAVRHDPKFAATAAGCESYKEKSTTADGCLNNAVSALENEIASLQGKKSQAERNRDDEYRNYENAKREEEEERQRWLDSLKKIF